jgi:hypothetical protein
MKQASSRTCDQTILSAWQQGLSEASKDATFKQALLQQEGELLPCFAEHYEKLKVLPRRMRRNLQRQSKRSWQELRCYLRAVRRRPNRDNQQPGRLHNHGCNQSKSTPTK